MITSTFSQCILNKYALVLCKLQCSIAKRNCSLLSEYDDLYIPNFISALETISNNNFSFHVSINNQQYVNASEFIYAFFSESVFLELINHYCDDNLKKQLLELYEEMLNEVHFEETLKALKASTDPLYSKLFHFGNTIHRLETLKGDNQTIISLKTLFNTIHIDVASSPKPNSAYVIIIDHFTKLTERICLGPLSISEINKTSLELEEKLYKKNISKPVKSAICGVFGALLGFALGFVIGIPKGTVSGITNGIYGAITGFGIGLDIGNGNATVQSIKSFTTLFNSNSPNTSPTIPVTKKTFAKEENAINQVFETIKTMNT